MMRALMSATFFILFFAASPAITQQQDGAIKTELEINGTQFKDGEPIIVDVWVTNQTKQVINRNHFSPLSSSVGLPDFVIARVPGGKPFSIPPGLYDHEWSQWYQPREPGREAFSVGFVALPAGERIHLLHGDLRLTIVRARQYCQGELDAKTLLDKPDNASTKKHYQDMVRSADDFLSGGTFDIYVQAYSKSQTVRIQIEPPSKGTHAPL